ncbi:MAG: GTPase [Planctomycetota bacterium]|nr:GTPase [Planctomycetota bacterium]
MTGAVESAARSAGFRVLTPPNVGAVAAIQLIGRIDAILPALGIPSVPVGSVRLVSLLGIDDGVVARWSEEFAELMPHAGGAVVRRLITALEQLGLRRMGERPEIDWPEASGRVEALALAAMGRTMSPRGVDRLLGEPARWRRWDGAAPSQGEVRAASATLCRLIEPPLIVAVGPANVGKSTLLNALARDSISIVSEEAGTTRDHVGALVLLDGLCVRWIDTPGVRPGDVGPIERAAVKAAGEVARAADLVISCGDAASGFLASAPNVGVGVGVLRVATRADLGVVGEAADAQVALPPDGTPDGLAELAGAIRRRLVSDEALAWPGPWLFDERLIATENGVR